MQDISYSQNTKGRLIGDTEVGGRETYTGEVFLLQWICKDPDPKKENILEQENEAAKIYNPVTLARMMTFKQKIKKDYKDYFNLHCQSHWQF